MTDRLADRIPIDRWPVWVRRVAGYSFLGGPLVVSLICRLGEDDSGRAYMAATLAGWMPMVLILGLYGYPPHATRSSSDWVRAWVRAVGGVVVLLGLLAAVTFYPPSLVSWPFHT